MPRFPSGADAYRWACGVLHLYRGARALNYDPDQVGQHSIYGDYKRLDAIQIILAAEEVCKLERGCQKTTDCLMRWCIPQPDGTFGCWTDAEKARVNGCLKALEKRLLWLGYIDYSVVAWEE